MIHVEQLQNYAPTFKRMASFEAALQEKIVTKALARGAKPVVDAMKETAPEQGGRLKRAVGRSKLSRSAMGRLGITGGKGRVATIVGPNRKVDGKRRGGIANILEGGAKAHVIKPKRLTGYLSIGKNSFARKVNHPGIRPTRFMQRALDQSEGKIQGEFFEGLRIESEKVIGK